MSPNYNILHIIIEFISEISGFADIFFVAAGFLLGQLHTPYSQQAQLLSSLAKVQGTHNFRGSARLPMTYLKQFNLQLSSVQLLLLSCLPGPCRHSHNIKKLRKTIRRQEEKIQEAADLASLIDLQEDMRRLLRLLMTKSQVWLFRNTSGGITLQKEEKVEPPDNLAEFAHYLRTIRKGSALN